MSDADKRVRAFIGADRRIDISERLAARAECTPPVVDPSLIGGKQLEIEKPGKDNVADKNKDVKDSKEEKDKEAVKETGKDGKDNKDDEKDTKDDDKEDLDKTADKEVAKDKEEKEGKEDKDEKEAKDEKETKDDKEADEEGPGGKPEDFDKPEDKEDPPEVLPAEVSEGRRNIGGNGNVSHVGEWSRPGALLKSPPVV